MTLSDPENSLIWDMVVKNVAHYRKEGYHDHGKSRWVGNWASIRRNVNSSDNDIDS